MLKIRSVPAFFIVASLVVLSGCHKGPKDGVVATVNGKPILRTDVDKIYQAQLASNPDQQSPSADQEDSLKINILHELIVEEIVEQRAAQQNLTATDADVDGKLAEMKAPYTEEQFQARLSASGRSLDDLKRDLRRSLTIDKLLNKEINSRITVTDADVSNYYAAHKAEYNLIETQYHLAQIQVTDQGSWRLRQPAEQQGHRRRRRAKKIQALKNRLDAGEDFGALAMNFSETRRTPRQRRATWDLSHESQ